MKHTAKALRMLCGMVVMLVLAASITAIPAYAASNGIYIATATPHYKHPVTGAIEDAGGDGSAVLGQSMTESATYRKALVEVDPQGNTYVTVRLKLMDNIQNPQFQVDGVPVSASLMQEDYSVNTADYRMRVGSEHSVIRCNMYVIAMGREVVFYITVSDLRAGSEDFITTVTVNQPAQPQQPAQPDTPETPSSPETPAPDTPAQPEPEMPTEDPVSPDPGTPGDSSKEDTPTGLQEFDASGSRVDQPSDDALRPSGSTLWWVLGGVAAVIAALCVWYFGFFRKKK